MYLSLTLSRQMRFRTPTSDALANILCGAPTKYGYVRKAHAPALARPPRSAVGYNSAQRKSLVLSIFLRARCARCRRTDTPHSLQWSKPTTLLGYFQREPNPRGPVARGQVGSAGGDDEQ